MKLLPDIMDVNKIINIIIYTSCMHDNVCNYARIINMVIDNNSSIQY